MATPIVSAGVSTGRVRGLIHDYSGFILEESFTSTAQQDAALDVLQPISFGASKVSSNGIVDWNDTTKEFTILKSGALGVKTRQRAQRIGAPSGVSDLFVQGQVSFDGGSSWEPLGNAVALKLDDTRQVEIFFDFAQFYAVAGVKFRQVFARSSTGTDSGSLIAQPPSAALVTAGFTTAPSAQISVYVHSDTSRYI